MLRAMSPSVPGYLGRGAQDLRASGDRGGWHRRRYRVRQDLTESYLALAICIARSLAGGVVIHATRAEPLVDAVPEPPGVHGDDLAVGGAGNHEITPDRGIFAIPA